MNKDRDAILFVAAFMTGGGIGLIVFCIGLIHGAIYGWLSLGVSLFLVGIAIGLFPWESK